MRKPESPCLDCKHRTADCHATCKCYKWYKHEQEIYKEFMANEKGEYQHIEYGVTRRRNMRCTKK